LKRLAQIRGKMGIHPDGFGKIRQLFERDGGFTVQEIKPSHKHQFELGASIFAGFGQAFDKTGAKMSPEPVGAGMEADRSKNTKIWQGEHIMLEAIQDMGFSASGFTVQKNGCGASFLSDRIQRPAAEIESIGMDFSDIGSAGPPGIGDDTVSKGVDHP